MEVAQLSFLRGWEGKRVRGETCQVPFLPGKKQLDADLARVRRADLWHRCPLTPFPRTGGRMTLRSARADVKVRATIPLRLCRTVQAAVTPASRRHPKGCREGGAKTSAVVWASRPPFFARPGAIFLDKPRLLWYARV